MNENLSKLLRKKEGIVARYISGAFIILAGLSEGLAYYLINYELCGVSDCSNLKVTSFWVTSSPMHLIMGACYIGVGVFVIKYKELSSIVSICITGSLFSGFLFSVMAVFAIANEIGQIT